MIWITKARRTRTARVGHTWRVTENANDSQELGKLCRKKEGGEVEEWEFLYRFSSDAYALGINIVVYTPTL